MEGTMRKIVKEKTVQEVANNIEQIFQSTPSLHTIYSNLISIKEQVMQLQKRWESMQKKQQKYMDEQNISYISINEDGSEKIHKTKIAYQALYKRKQSAQFRADALLVISRAEIFIDKMRVMLTGKEITYSLGFNFRNEFKEYNLSLIDLLQNTILSIDSQSQTLKLRIARARSSLMEAFKQYELSERENENHVENHDAELWKKLQIHWKDNMQKKYKEKTVNEGVLYETYRYLIFHKKTNLDLTKQEDLDTFENALVRSMNSTSGRRGGDVGDAQVKFFGASFASLQEIYNTLNSLEQLLRAFLYEGGKKADLVSGLQKMFTKDPSVLDMVERGAEDKARERINTIINSMTKAQLVE